MKKAKLIYKKCEWCEKEFHKRIGKNRESMKQFIKRRFCSIPCRLKWQEKWYKEDNPIKYFDNSGKNNPMFGRVAHNFNKDGNKRRDGYFRIAVNKKRMLKHRYIMEQNIGRKLLDIEVVHHLDGNPSNNNLENLQIMSLEEHSRLHGYKNKNTLQLRTQTIPA